MPQAGVFDDVTDCGPHVGNYLMASTPRHPLWLLMLRYIADHVDAVCAEPRRASRRKVSAFSHHPSPSLVFSRLRPPSLTFPPGGR